MSLDILDFSLDQQFSSFIFSFTNRIYTNCFKNDKLVNHDNKYFENSTNKKTKSISIHSSKPTEEPNEEIETFHINFELFNNNEIFVFEDKQNFHFPVLKLEFKEIKLYEENYSFLSSEIKILNVLNLKKRAFIRKLNKKKINENLYEDENLFIYPLFYIEENECLLTESIDNDSNSTYQKFDNYSEDYDKENGLEERKYPNSAQLIHTKNSPQKKSCFMNKDNYDFNSEDLIKSNLLQNRSHFMSFEINDINNPIECKKAISAQIPIIKVNTNKIEKNQIQINSAISEEDLFFNQIKNSEKHFEKPKISEILNKNNNINMLKRKSTAEYDLISYDFMRGVIKEGWLLKKSRNLLARWQKRWFLLTNDKLIYFNDEKKEVPKGFISFKEVRTLLETKNNSIMISYIGYSKKIKLKPFGKESLQQWIDRLQQLIQFSKTNISSIINKQFLNFYWRQDIISQTEFEKIANSGDILLFNSNHIAAKIQRTFTGSKYDHVGLVYRYKEDLYVVDATYEVGVNISEWKEFVEENDLLSRIVLRKLIHSEISILKNRLFEFINENLSKRYKLTTKKLLNRKTKFEKIPEIDKNIQNSAESYIRKEEFDGFFCSELVAGAYKKMGLLNPKIPSSKYWPGSFSSEKKLNLLQGAKLSHEINVLLNVHLET